jgi:PA-IL-like protein
MGDYIVIQVPAKVEGGVKSGVTVKAGDVFTVSGSGRAAFTADPKGPVTYPDGTRYVQDKYFGAYMAPNLALDGVPVGTLIARIGSGPWLAVGSAQTFQAQVGGEVILAYNDRPGSYGDNSGEYSALVENHGSI